MNAIKKNLTTLFIISMFIVLILAGKSHAGILLGAAAGICPLLLVMSGSAVAGNVTISSDPYPTAGLFTNPVLPVEGQEVSINVRAQVTGELASDPQAHLKILSPDGSITAEHTLTLKRGEGIAEGVWKWTGGKNGLYTVSAEVGESSCQITLPVLVEGRTPHLVWYREDPNARWMTCVTSANDEDLRKRLAERGIMPLKWGYAGMSWRSSGSYDKSKLETDPEGLLEDIEQTFYRRYTVELPKYAAGFGLDETGGYPSTMTEKFSIASMKALARAKKEYPEHFFAVWHSGGIRNDVAQYIRQGADLLLLECYVWRALPESLGTEDIYQNIRDRLDPLIRSTDMLMPAYGNHCYTLIAFDLGERPDYTDLGELEQVVRYVRRICPEMRGICWYNAISGDGRWGLKRTPEVNQHQLAVLEHADKLSFEYFIKPCVTFMRESLWLNRVSDGQWKITGAVSNIGCIDSGPVVVEFLMDGKRIGEHSATGVPAGPNRNHNRGLMKQSIAVESGMHRFEARIKSASGSTVLDGSVQCDRFIQ